MIDVSPPLERSARPQWPRRTRARIPVRACAVVFASLFLVVVDGAHAQDDAASAFARGVEAMEATDFAAALEAFTQAERLHPHGVNRFNMATCLEELSRLRDAIEQYGLAIETRELPAERAQAAELRRQRLRERLGTLRFAGDGHAVIVDDQRCTAPCEMRVDPGRHLARYTHAGSVGEEGEREVSVSDGGETLVELPTPTEAAPVARLDVPAASTPRSGNGWMIGGAAVALLGGAGTLGFGLRARSQHDQYLASPTENGRNDGLRSRRLTNASIAVVGLGAAVLLVGLVLKLKGRSSGDDPLALAVSFPR